MFWCIDWISNARAMDTSDRRAHHLGNALSVTRFSVYNTFSSLHFSLYLSVVSLMGFPLIATGRGRALAESVIPGVNDKQRVMVELKGCSFSHLFEICLKALCFRPPPRVVNNKQTVMFLSKLVLLTYKGKNEQSSLHPRDL